MKILKKAVQKNVVLNKEYYTTSQLNAMLAIKQICYFDNEMNQCYEPIEYYEQDEKEFRLFTEDLDEIKVKLDPYGHYTNVAIDKDGFMYYIVL